MTTVTDPAPIERTSLGAIHSPKGAAAIASLARVVYDARRIYPGANVVVADAMAQLATWARQARLSMWDDLDVNEKLQLREIMRHNLATRRVPGRP